MSAASDITDAKEACNQHQFSTFYVSGRLYGIDVTKVQEVVRTLPMTPIPLSEDYVLGLINLRGQVATAIGLQELFGFNEQTDGELMNVVCKCEGNLISLQVDGIGDVIEVSEENFEPIPQTISTDVRKFMSGVCKVSDKLLSIIDINLVMKDLNSQ